MSEKQRIDSADSGKSTKKPCCEPASRLYIGMVIAASVVYVITLIINCSYSAFSAMFYADNMTRRDEDSGFNPASWAFSIWAFIYTWNLILIAYSIASLFPSTCLHRAPLALFPVYIVNNLCGTLWFVFSEQYLYWPGTLAIIGLPITLYICIVLSIWGRWKHRCQFFLYTYLFDNALALYAGWCTVAYLLYTTTTLVYGHNFDKTDTGTFFLSWLLIKLTVFCSLEVTLLDKYMRHIWTHYLAIINAVTGSLLENYDPSNRNSVITVAIAGIVGVAFLVKLLRIAEARCKRPDWPVSNVVGPEPSASSLGSVIVVAPIEKT